MKTREEKIEYQKQWVLHHPNYNKEWREKNKEHRKQYEHNRYTIKKEQVKKYNKEYYSKNKDYFLSKRNEWLENNPEYHNEYVKQKRRTNIQFKMTDCLRTRLWHALRGNAKKGSAVRLLGCSLEMATLLIEAQFMQGMNWDNWGKGKDKWNIDHKIALSNFDLTDEKQLNIVCHISNLQPMWELDNIKKGNKVI